MLPIYGIGILWKKKAVVAFVRILSFLGPKSLCYIFKASKFSGQIDFWISHITFQKKIQEMICEPILDEKRLGG